MDMFRVFDTLDKKV